MHGGCGNLGGVMLWSCEGKDSFCVTKPGVIMKRFCTGSSEGIAFFLTPISDALNYHYHVLIPT
jgi:hypothetical protein